MSALAWVGASVGYLLSVAVIGPIWYAFEERDGRAEGWFFWSAAWPLVAAALAIYMPLHLVGTATYRLATLRRRKRLARAQRQARIAKLERELEIGQ